MAESSGPDSVTVVGRSGVSVFCIDDHAGFREVVRELIAVTPGFVLLGEASSGEEAIEALAELRPDLVLMDVRMPGMGGFRAAEILAAARLDLFIALMSADPVEPPPGFAPRPGRIAFVAKRELSRRRLLELWDRREIT